MLHNAGNLSPAQSTWIGLQLIGDSTFCCSINTEPEPKHIEYRLTNLEAFEDANLKIHRLK